MPCWPKSKLKKSTKSEDKANQRHEQKSPERTNYQTIEENCTRELEHWTQEDLTAEDQGNGTGTFPEENPLKYCPRISQPFVPLNYCPRISQPSIQGLHSAHSVHSQRHPPCADQITLYHYTNAEGYDAILASGVVLGGPGACGTGVVKLIVFGVVLFLPPSFVVVL